MFSYLDLTIAESNIISRYESVKNAENRLEIGNK